jgi:hypothetical protein
VPDVDKMAQQLDEVLRTVGEQEGEVLLFNDV